MDSIGHLRGEKGMSRKEHMLDNFYSGLRRAIDGRDVLEATDKEVRESIRAAETAD